MHPNTTLMSFLLWRQFRRFKSWATCCWLLTPICVVAAIAAVSVPQLWVSAQVNVSMLVGGLGCAWASEILRRRSMRKSQEYEEAAKEAALFEFGFTDQTPVGVRGADGVVRMFRKNGETKP